ncbi:MAG TPA: hypothetical protein EYH59_00230, partial [Pyrodictium sp.]|nr:hypothetical protein [Pyrodictium sp.]
RTVRSLSLVSLLAAIASLTCSLSFLTSNVHVSLLEKEFVLSSFEAYNLVLVSVVYLISSLSLAPALAELVEEGLRSTRTYVSLFNMSFAMMLLVVVSNNMFVIWVLLELLTLLAVYLVAVKGGRATEAGWKYLILCGVGMAFSLYGFVILYGLGVRHGIEMPWLVSNLAGQLHDHRPLVALASVFILAGFSVKAGLFPAYMWLPDAHAEAFYSVSALLSGALIYLPLYVLYKMFSVVAHATFAVHVLFCIAVVSILVGAAGMLVTSDIKRLYAYSSIEHMGFLASFIAAYYGLGDPITSYIAFNLHALGHAIAKAAVFVGAGYLAYAFRTRNIDKIDVGIEKIAGWSLFIHTITLAGIPPFPLFISKLLGFLAFAKNTPALIAYTVVVFVAFTAIALRLSHLYALKTRINGIRRPKYSAMASLAVLLGVVFLLLVSLAFFLGVKVDTWR